MRIQPARRVRGRLQLPGDKSITHRAAIMAALAEGRTRLENFSTSEDCASTLACLSRLGVAVKRAGTNVEIEGAGQRGLSAPREPLDCGNSGSTMRMLAGVLASQPFTSELTGDESLRARPMRRIIEPLERMGAQLSSEDGHAPLRINGRRPLTSISYRMNVASAQVKSCILLAGLGAEGRTEVIEETAATRDHTERLLRWFGASVETRAETDTGTSSISINGLTQLPARDVKVPGDISSATFFMIAAALLRDSDLQIEHVGLNPTRTQVIATLQSLGADVRAFAEREQCNEEVGSLHVRGCRGVLAPSRYEGAACIVLRGAEVARLIDELPALAVFGTQLAGGIKILDASELRVKESDRIRATVENLRAMGASVEEFEDGLTVEGCARLRGAKLNSYGDHRIAMAFTVAALIAEGESELVGADCVRISFPEFFELLESVIER